MSSAAVTGATFERSRPAGSRVAFVIVLAIHLYATALPAAAKLVPAAGKFRMVALAVVVIASLHALLAHAVSGARRDWAIASALTLPPAVLATTAALKSDWNFALGAAITVLAVSGLASIPMAEVGRAFRAYLFVAIAVSLVGAEFLPGMAVPGRDFLPFFIDGRSQGFFGQPNMMGIQSGLAIVVGVSSLRLSPSSVFLTLLGGIGLLASASQTSLLGTVAALTVYVGFAAYRRRGVIGAVATTAVGAAAGFFVIQRLGIVQNAYGGTAELSFTGRVNVWRTLLQYGDQVGWLGLTDARFTEITQHAAGVSSAHNLWLEMWARSGPVGVAATALSVAIMVGWSIRERSIGASAATAFIVVVSLMEGVLMALPLAPLLAAVYAAVRFTEIRGAQLRENSAAPVAASAT